MAMGLLDSLMFNPQSYGGQGGGLLDFLRNIQTQQQIQPSAGLADQSAASFADRFNALPNAPQPFSPSGRSFDSAQFDPRTFAPNQAQPIAVGDYNMPRIGSASLYESQSAQLPPNAQPTQGQLPQQQLPPQPQQPLPPALGGTQQQNGFLRGLQSIANGGGLISALTGNYNDPASIQRQNLKAQYDALVPLVGSQKAMLAVMNPEAGKTILAQALEKKNYGFTKLDNDTVLRTDPLTGNAEVAYGGGTPRTITGPDGKQIPIPPGVDRKTFVNEVSRANAKAAAGEKTEVQAKSEKFGNKMETAESAIGKLEGEGTSQFGRALESVPMGNYAQSEKYQKYKQARDNFITALLRDESGAAIGSQEFNRYEKELFPQPGDSQAVINQKRNARKVAIEAMKKSAGPGYKSPEMLEPEQQATVDRSAVEAEMRKRGLIK